jgi:hypothetical protein
MSDLPDHVMTDLVATIDRLRAENERLRADVDHWKQRWEQCCNERLDEAWGGPRA